MECVTHGGFCPGIRWVSPGLCDYILGGGTPISPVSSAHAIPGRGRNAQPAPTGLLGTLPIRDYLDLPSQDLLAPTLLSSVLQGKVVLLRARTFGVHLLQRLLSGAR